MNKKYIENNVRFLLILLFILAIISMTTGLLFQKKLLLSWYWWFLPITLFVVATLYYYYGVYEPYTYSKHALSLFADGLSTKLLTQSVAPLSPEMEEAQNKISAFLNTDQIRNLSKRQAQFLALQNQINPHFLYNTLEGIRSEALIGGLSTVANMAEALSTFFRYTISHVENLVTLQMELDNTRNYFFIQQYRFGQRLHLTIDIEEEDKETTLKCRIPKLTLQPIVENCIIHGLECKVGEGHLHIKQISTKNRLLITVSDDGVGIEEPILKKIQERLTFHSLNYGQTTDSNKGIALENVNNRIKLLFGEEYGVTIESTVGVGTDVHISLPRSIAGDFL